MNSRRGIPEGLQAKGDWSKETRRPEGASLACDIGTTTLAFALVDERTGGVLDGYTCLNPQRRFGADVMSRIGVCASGGLERLCSLVRSAMCEAVERFIERYSLEEIETLWVSANTVMMYIFAGMDPSAAGLYPFTLPVLDFSDIEKKLVLPHVRNVRLLPCAGAFVGADAAAGAALYGFADDLFCEKDEKAPCGVCGRSASGTSEPRGRKDGMGALLYIDIGTNAEIILKRGGVVIASSCAAGPALEGAGISCGMSVASGAVCSVSPPRLANRGMKYPFMTIDDAPPCGICGSGLFDLVAALIKSSYTDKYGRIESDFVLCERLPSEESSAGEQDFSAFDTLAQGVHISHSGTVLPHFKSRSFITLTASDIRQFMLAKSAVCSGIQTLLSITSTEADDIEKIYIAGAFGGALNIKSALLTGLLPETFCDKIISVANASLDAAIRCISDTMLPAKAKRLCKSASCINLGESELFSELFIKNLSFPPYPPSSP